MATVTITIRDDEENGRIQFTLDGGEDRIHSRDQSLNTQAQNMAYQILLSIGDYAEKIHEMVVDGEQIPLVNPQLN